MASVPTYVPVYINEMHKTKLRQLMASLMAGRRISTKNKSLSGKAFDYASQCAAKYDYNCSSAFMAVYDRAVEIEEWEKEEEMPHCIDPAEDNISSEDVSALRASLAKVFSLPFSVKA